jgi:hypothetical protein
LTWPVALDGRASPDLVEAVSDSGVVPWLDLRFTTGPPLLENIESLESELEAAAMLASVAGSRGHFQITWVPTASVEPEVWVKDYAFLLKRAAVAVTGAQATARVITEAMNADPGLISHRR